MSRNYLSPEKFFENIRWSYPACCSPGMPLRGSPVDMRANGELMFELASKNMIFRARIVKQKFLRSIEFWAGGYCCLDLIHRLHGPLRPPYHFTLGLSRLQYTGTPRNGHPSRHSCCQPPHGNQSFCQPIGIVIILGIWILL